VGNLAESLVMRYHVLGDVVDLNEAVVTYRQALELCTPGQMQHGRTLRVLAWTLAEVYDETRQLHALEETVNLHLQVVCEPSRPEYDGWNSHTGGVLVRRFKHYGNRTDLDRAISHLAVAEQLRPAGHIFRGQTLLQYAEALYLRHQLKKNDADAELAVRYLNEILQLYPHGRARRAAALRALARFHMVADSQYYDVEHAMDLQIQALEEPHRIPGHSLINAMDALDHIQDLAERNGLPEHLLTKLLDMHCRVVEMLPQVAYFGVHAGARLRVLKRADALAAQAAGSAVRAGKCITAVELLEEAGALFWSQHLRLRTPFTGLPDHLSRQLKDLARDLQLGSVREDRTGDGKDDRLAREAEQSAIRRKGEEFDKLMQDVRSLPGFERFLLSNKYSTLKLAAATFPVAVLFATKAHCYIVLLECWRDVPLVIPVSGIDGERLRELRQGSP
jgi:tetratricopeptide (TPR) repeat protein